MADVIRRTMTLDAGYHTLGAKTPNTWFKRTVRNASSTVTATSSAFTMVVPLEVTHG